MFQSAPPREGRPRSAASHARRSRHVSIRAPARGATRASMPRRLARMHVSIRAPARGATRRWRPAVRPARWFQSAPPREGRPCDRRAQRWLARRFNPRPRARGDRVGRIAASDRTAVSIRAPARGATLGFLVTTSGALRSLPGRFRSAPAFRRCRWRRDRRRSDLLRDRRRARRASPCPLRCGWPRRPSHGPPSRPFRCAPQSVRCRRISPHQPVRH